MTKEKREFSIGCQDIIIANCGTPLLKYGWDDYCEIVSLEINSYHYGDLGRKLMAFQANMDLAMIKPTCALARKAHHKVNRRNERTFSVTLSFHAPYLPRLRAALRYWYKRRLYLPSKWEPGRHVDNIEFID